MKINALSDKKKRKKQLKNVIFAENYKYENLRDM